MILPLILLFVPFLAEATIKQQYLCPLGHVPFDIVNNDGYLELKCMKPKCEDINKIQEVCEEAWVTSCKPGQWVGGILRSVHGTDKKAVYRCRCCNHPSMLNNLVSKRPVVDFAPANEEKDKANAQADLIQVVSNVGTHLAKYDHYTVEVSMLQCGRTSTSRRTTFSTQRPTPKPDHPKPGGVAGDKDHDKDKDPDKSDENDNNDEHDNDHGHPSHPAHPTGGHPGHSGGGGGGGGGGHPGGSHPGGSHPNSGHPGSSHPGGEHSGGHGSKTLTGDNLNEGQPYDKFEAPPLPDKPPPNADNPKAWGLGGPGGPGCFSADTLVQTRTGKMPMSKLRIGDEILSSVNFNGNNDLAYQPVIEFIHKDSETLARYVAVSTESGRLLKLTSEHLLPQFDCKELSAGDFSTAEYERMFIHSAKFARRTRVGQCLLVVDENGHLRPDRVTNVTSVLQRGIFSPITPSGIIVANDVQTSCYSSIENHALQHSFFSVIRRVCNYFQPLQSYLKESFFPKPKAARDGEEAEVEIPYLLRATLALYDLVIGS